MGGVPVEEQRGEAQRGAEHDAGRQVAPPGSADPDQLHRRRRRRGYGHEAESGLTPTRKARRTAGGADVGEGVAGERLAADDREDADHAGDDGDDPADDQCHCGPGGWRRSPGSKTRGQGGASAERSALGAARGRRDGAWRRRVSRPGDDEYPVVDVDHVDMVAVELAEHLGA